MNYDATDLTGKAPEWWLSGACGALHNLPAGDAKDALLSQLEAIRTVLANYRQIENEAKHGPWRAG